MPIEKNTIAIVEDSSDCADQHRQHLKANGANSIIFRSSGEFEKFISEQKNLKRLRLKTVITDGLEGNWRSVVESARSHGIETVWLITGNSNFISESKSLSGVKAISKAELHQNPEQYKRVAE